MGFRVNVIRFCLNVRVKVFKEPVQVLRVSGSPYFLIE